MTVYRNPAGERLCTRCNESPSKPGDSYCASCASAKAMNWNKANPEAYKAAGLRWRERNRERLRLYAVEHRKTHVDPRPTNNPKRRVQKRVFKAIKSGKLIRPDVCSRCSKPCVPDAHHHRGYEEDAVFDVIWLCRSCHRTIHWR